MRFGSVSGCLGGFVGSFVRPSPRKLRVRSRNFRASSRKLCVRAPDPRKPEVPPRRPKRGSMGAVGRPKSDSRGPKMTTRRPKRPPRRLQMDGPNGENTTFGQRAVLNRARGRPKSDPRGPKKAARRPKRPPRRSQIDGPNGETTAFGQRAVQTGKTRVIFHRFGSYAPA